MDYGQEVPAAARTLQLLEALAAAPEGMTASDLEAQLDISRSTLFALLNTLKTRQYVVQSEQRGRYRLGPALWGLLPGRTRGLSALVDAFHADAELEALPETVAVAALEADDSVILAQRESRQPVRAAFRLAERDPAPDTAAGLVLLAGRPRESLTHRYRPRIAELAPLLAEVRRRGWRQQTGSDVVDIAYPICVDGVQPVAALVARIPAYRWSEAGQGDVSPALHQNLQEAARRLSHRLGAAVYQPYGWARHEALGPSQTLDEAAVRDFLRGPRNARLACLRRDGTPHVLPLWYEWDGQDVWVVASPGANWKEYVVESGRVSLTVDEPWPPLRRAFIAGRAEQVAPDEVAGGLAGLRRRLALRYLGPGVEESAELADAEGWSAFRIVPEKISGRQGLGH